MMFAWVRYVRVPGVPEGNPPVKRSDHMTIVTITLGVHGVQAVICLAH